MDSICKSRLTTSTAVLAAILVLPQLAFAQVRTKQPDRGVYRSPTVKAPRNTRGGTPTPVPDASEESPQEAAAPPTKQRDDGDLVKLIRASGTPARPIRKPKFGLVDAPLEDGFGNRLETAPRAPAQETRPAPELKKRVSPRPRRAAAVAVSEESAKLKPVAHERVVLVRPGAPRPTEVVATSEHVQTGETWFEPAPQWDDAPIIHDGTCDGCADCNSMGCDGMGCDLGCDSMYCGESPWYHGWANSHISFDKRRWFGSIELLLMWRRGDRLPPLVTTGPDTDPDTAGELGQPGTEVLVGGDSILKDLTAGGRLTLGTWLDRQECRSLVLRAWFAGEETFGFHATQDQVPVLARPFLNVSDNQAAEQDTQLVAFPNRADGSISVRADNQVYGTDLSVRQFWYGKYGATVDVLYGYQYMGMTSDLSISNTSTSLDDDFAPLGAILSVSDDFDISNDFHGGQIGLASRYREGCWSFNALAKVGFGSLRRRARLTGSTVTSIDGATAVSPNGLLVRSTNAGTVTDHTFGWVPELDFSIAWQRYPQFELTLGYHIIAMTDALAASGAIDPALAVNLSDPPTGQQRPTTVLDFETFYVQGIHFGLQKVY